MKRQLRVKAHASEQAQDYQPRVEVVIEALSHTLVGCNMMVTFLLEQESADWPHAHRLVEAAKSDLGRAQTWLQKHETAESRREKRRLPRLRRQHSYTNQPQN